MSAGQFIAGLDAETLALHFEYLDELREFGTTNMFGAAPYLADAMELDVREARQALAAWMDTFGEQPAMARAVSAIAKATSK